MGWKLFPRFSSEIVLTFTSFDGDFLLIRTCSYPSCLCLKLNSQLIHSSRIVTAFRGQMSKNEFSIPINPEELLNDNGPFAVDDSYELSSEDNTADSLIDGCFSQYHVLLSSMFHPCLFILLISFLFILNCLCDFNFDSNANRAMSILLQNWRRVFAIPRSPSPRKVFSRPFFP